MTDLSNLAETIETADLASRAAFVGFDGFVDEMASVVLERTGPTEWRSVPTIGALGEIITAAAGRSFGREIVVHEAISGGNGPNLADGLLALGLRVHYGGTLGQPIHAVFHSLSERCESCHSIGTGVGRTLALEFQDGKLMLNDTAPMPSVTPATIRQLASNPALEAAWPNLDLLAMVNWSRFPHMTACWTLVADEILPRIDEPPWILLDLADPSGRSAADISEMLNAVRALAVRGRVAMGLNAHEAGVIASAIGEPGPGDSPDGLADAARMLQTRLGCHVVTVHSHRHAACAIDGHAAAIDTAFTPSPVRSTGVGDRFNAGFAAGLLLGLEPRDCLRIGCAAGGWFVRMGRPASRAELATFLRAWQRGDLDRIHP